MCNFFSGIITREGVVMHNAAESDSHEDIVSKFSLKDTDHDTAQMDWARFEITPPDGDVFKPFDKWAFRIDQGITPDWFNDGYKAFCFDALIEFSKDHFITDYVEEIFSGRYWMSGTARVGTMSGTARVDLMRDTARVDWMSGTARVGTMRGTARVGTMRDTARVDLMSGTARVDLMSGTARVDWMSGTARVGTMSGTARVGTMLGTARVDLMSDTARVGTMLDTARVDWMLGTASVGTMRGTARVEINEDCDASVESIEDRAIVVKGNKIIVASGSEFKISRTGKIGAKHAAS